MSWVVRGMLPLVLAAPSIQAQRDSVVLRGTVVDYRTGRPVSGAYVAFPIDARGWTVADTQGRFTLWTLARGRQALLVACPRPRDVWGETLDTLTINLHSTLDTALLVPVASSRCELPAFSERHLELRGFFSVGFEENRFFPDLDSTGKPLIWGGHESSRHAAVSWTVEGRAQRPPWPAPLGGLASSHCYRVHWVGTLTGPGAKNPAPPGWIPASGIAAFAFAVDSTIDVQAASPSACSQP